VLRSGTRKSDDHLDELELSLCFAIYGDGKNSETRPKNIVCHKN
jgi:hypothetical protein